MSTTKKPFVVTPQAAVRILLFHGGVSIACIPVFIFFESVGWIGAWSGAIWFMTALLASGEGMWMSLRLRDARCALVTFLALPALGFWSWVLYLKVYGQNAT